MSFWKRLFTKDKTTVTTDKVPNNIYITKEEYEKPVCKILIDPPEIKEVVLATIVEDTTPIPSSVMLPDIKALNLMEVEYIESPNKSSRAKGQSVTHIVLHHTGPGTLNGVVSWLTNKDAKASAHYVIGTNGKLVQLVNTTKRAWHAGTSRWNNINDVNNFSVGIEICNMGRLESSNGTDFYYEQGRKMVKYSGNVVPVHGKIIYPNGTELTGYYVPYPEIQINSLVSLCKALVIKYPAITRDNIITHYQIAQPEGRKNDPFGMDLEYIKKLVFGV